MNEDEASAQAARMLAEAAALPTLTEVRELATRAVARGGTKTMSLDEIRFLAGRAAAGAEELAVMMRRLATLLDEDGPDDADHDVSGGDGEQ